MQKLCKASHLDDRACFSHAYDHKLLHNFEKKLISKGKEKLYTGFELLLRTSQIAKRFQGLAKGNVF